MSKWRMENEKGEWRMNVENETTEWKIENNQKFHSLLSNQRKFFILHSQFSVLQNVNSFRGKVSFTKLKSCEENFGAAKILCL